MKKLSLLILFFAMTARAESVHFQPGLNLFQEEATLTDLFGSSGTQLCGPVSVAHAFNYLKYSHVPPYSSLLTFPDMDHDGVANTYRDQIRFFFQTCKTDRNAGTHYQELAACMRDYMSQSGVGTWAYLIGPHANIAPPNSTLAETQGIIVPSNIRYYLNNHAAVIMGIGWYNYNSVNHTYTRIGGHIFNVYGFDYDPADGESKISLDVVNSLTNYQGRAPAQMFDTVTMTLLPTAGEVIPSGIAYRLDGPGFQYTQVSLVEDLFVAFPIVPGALPSEL